MRALLATFLVLALPSAALALQQTPAQAPASGQPPASQVTPDSWPKMTQVNNINYTLYQPQLDKWDGYTIEAHAAVSVQAADAKEPIFGVVEISAVTNVDKQASTVYFDSIQITKATFPSAPSQAPVYKKAIQEIVNAGPATMSLGRLQAAAAIEGAQLKSKTVPVKNDAPQILFKQSAAVLVLIDGDPIWHAEPNTSLKRVLNTRALVLQDSKGNLYVHILDGYMTAKELQGPWTVAATPPKGANSLAQKLAKQNVVDLMEGQPNQDTGKKPTLAGGAPEMVVATKPTEIIITKGPMEWMPIDNTSLIYVMNTTGNIFRDIDNQQVYVLVTGRWFTAPNLPGPWSYISGKDLPVDFALIPDTSPKENVKASVPGTPQAEDAAIQAQIPQMATIYRNKVSFTPVVSGAPVLKPIPDTMLSYVYNSPQPIIKVSATQWYAVQAGVWFTATSLSGPWVVASFVPAAIYSIPPSSSLYYVTFAYIYQVTPTTVVVGYTPGYTGVLVTPDGTVVYGTGYYYTPYVSATVWYPAPVTYGYAANVTYTPWTGWAVGFAIGWSAAHWCYCPAPYWGAMPYSPYAYHGVAYGAYGGAAAWGPGGWAATSGNVYHQYGATSAVTRSSSGYNAWTGTGWSSKVGTSYNSVTGRASAGQSASVANAYTGNYAYGNRGATYNPSTGVAASGGKVTVGNAYTGQQSTYGHATVSGPGGQTTHVAESGNTYYADHDGNVYNYNADTGQAQKYNSDGSWSDVDKPDSSLGQSGDSFDSAAASRQVGDAQSASSAWGGNWDGGSGGGGSGFGGGSGSGGSGGGGWGGGSGSGGFGGGSGDGGMGGGSGGGGWGGGGWGGGGGSFGGFRGGGGRR
jgi:hypothetical protein